MNTSKRFEIGTIRDGNFAADTIGNDPALTTFDTLAEAEAELQQVAEHAVEMWGQPLNGGAILDSETGEIILR